MRKIKYVRKTTALAMSAMLSLGLLAGCGSSDSNTNASGDASGDASADAKTATASVKKAQALPAEMRRVQIKKKPYMYSVMQTAA